MRVVYNVLPIQLAQVSQLLRICQFCVQTHNSGVAAMIGYAADEIDVGKPDAENYGPAGARLARSRDDTDGSDRTNRKLRLR